MKNSFLRLLKIQVPFIFSQNLLCNASGNNCTFAKIRKAKLAAKGGDENSFHLAYSKQLILTS